MVFQARSAPGNAVHALNQLRELGRFGGRRVAEGQRVVDDPSNRTDSMLVLVRPVRSNPGPDLPV